MGHILYGCGPLPFEGTLFVVAAAVFTSLVPRGELWGPRSGKPKCSGRGDGCGSVLNWISWRC